MKLDSPKVLAVITARGGSKGLPRKNLLPAGGKPLLAWTIEAAKKSKCITKLVVSTDDDEIIDVALNLGCEVPFKRPAELATDKAVTVDVLLHALSVLPNYDYLMLLQPTSPLRTSDDIDSAFQLMLTRGAEACVSVCPVDESPYWMFRVDNADAIRSVMSETNIVSRRQDLEPVFILNGAIYIAKSNFLFENRTFISNQTVGYIMPRERSLDIDSDDDYINFKRLVE